MTLPADKPDVFVSYSRVDKTFVERLSAGLGDHQRAAWVDWEGIAPTAEWLAEIMLAIDRANSFLFVISPASLQSEICRQEIDHAVARGKRLIPVLREDVPEGTLPAALAGVQWIALRPADDFEAGLAQLVTAIDTDLDHVKTHTRFLLKAIEWEDGAEAGRLLRGLDLDRAEQWLVNSASKEPKPTALHSRHVIASRKAASQQQRRTIAAVVAALVATIGLAAFAWQQRGVALANEAEAERQRQIAVANEEEAQQQQRAAEENAAEANRQWLQAERENIRALVNGSRSFLNTGQELEALTAALSAAVKVRGNPQLVDGTVEWHRTVLTLRRALFDTRERNRVRGDHGRGVTDVVFHPDGQSLYLAGGSRWISQMALDGRELNRFETMHFGLTDGCTSIAHMEINPEDGSLVTIGNELGIAHWTPDGRLIRAVESEFWAVTEGCTGLLRARVDFERDLVILSSVDETRSWTFDGAPGPTVPHPANLSWNAPEHAARPDGAYSVEKPGRGQPVVLRSPAGDELLQLPRQRGATFHPAAEQLITIADTIDDTVIHFWDIHPPGDDTFAKTNPLPRTRGLVLDGVTFEVVPFGRGNDPRDFFGKGHGALNAVMSMAAVLTDHHGTQVEIWSLPNGPDGAGATRLSSFANDQIASADFMSALSGMSFSPDGTVLATAGTDGTVKLWQMDGTLIETLVAHSLYATVSFSPDGLLLVTGGDTWVNDPVSVKVWSVDGALLDSLSETRLDFTAPHFDSSGQFITADPWDRSEGDLIWVHDLDWLIAASCDAIGLYLSHAPLPDGQKDMCSD